MSSEGAGMGQVEAKRPERVAVVGGGVSGAAAAASLLLGARTRGRALDVSILTAARDDLDEGPVLLTSECRSRLASLGCRVPSGWSEGALQGVEVRAGRSSERLAFAEGGTWAVDAFPHGPSGRSLVRDLLLASAHVLGARVLRRRVDGVERTAPLSGMPAGRGAGLLVIRSAGWRERFDTAILATGPGALQASPLLPGYQPPPLLQVAQARLAVAEAEVPQPAWMRLWLAPLPGMDALLLIPCPGSVWALGIGRAVGTADLCQALMCAARDGLLAEGFGIASLSQRLLPAGAGTHLVADGRLAVGHAALGSPLQLALSQVLATSTRAANALFDVGGEADVLRRRYTEEALFSLCADARLSARALPWLARAGHRGPAALLRAAARPRRPNPWAGGVLGLPSPAPRALLGAARRAAYWSWLVDLWPSLDALEPVTGPLLEPDLYYLVDDDPSVREGITALLESHGARVVTFSDESALIAATARRPPSAVILDVVLRWVDGLRLCAELKRHPSTRDTRVIVISGLGQRHVRERALSAGAEAFLEKPVVPGELLQALIHGPGARPPSTLALTPRPAPPSPSGATLPPPASLGQHAP